jgi:prepilin-type N-terminal cleavage/methylation domain-containing protein
MGQMFKKNAIQGFTLIEMIVVMVIVGMLLVGGVSGWLGWQRYAVFRQNEAYAQSLFGAAQSGFGQAKAGGRLEQFWQESSSWAVPVPEGVLESAQADGQLYYIDMMPEDEKGDNPFYRLIRPYVYDPEILEGPIRIEFDPVGGIVYSLSYCDRVDGFDYSAADGSDEVMGLAGENREKQKRQKLMLGYYEAGG